MKTRIKDQNAKDIMISKTIRIASAIVLASFAFSSAAGATCSNASLSGAYGFLHDGTDSTGAPATAAVAQITFDPITGTFKGEQTASHDGAIVTNPISGTYTIASNCTGTGTPAAGVPFSIMVTSTGIVGLHLLAEGFAVQQGSATCTNAGVKGRFGFETTGVVVAGPDAGAVAYIGELKLSVDASGDGVISGHLSSSEGSTFIAEEPVTGSYTVSPDCAGRATITPEGHPEMRFRLVVVNGGNQMLVIETDPNTVVSGTLQR
jgi:hypothetical protein